jgi:putative ABC transport system permease protein
MASGWVGGVAAGWLLAEVLVAVLSGVFDPPPDVLTVPWPYLPVIGVGTVAALALAAAHAIRKAAADPMRVLREL